MTRSLSPRRAVLLTGVAAVLALGLAACGGGNSSPPPAAVVVAPPASLESMFGANFATAYDASNNTQPSSPGASDIIPLDLTKQPTPLHS